LFLSVGFQLGVLNMADFTKLRSIRQLAKENPSFTEAQLRWLVFNAGENGLGDVLVKIGRRVYFEMDAFGTWLESRRGGIARVKQ
jgi:hypothetical protein